MRGWSQDVRIVPGNDGYAYVPGQILVKVEATAALQRAAVRILNDQEVVRGEGAGQRYCGETWVDSGEDHWLVPDYDGDVVGAVRRLRGAGITAQPNHVFFAHNRRPQADPGYADPGYADPGYADPGYADPGYADPGYADPGYADPGYADPGYADPGYADPDRRRGNRNSGGNDYASLVYPNPVYARTYYRGQAGARYEITGERPSNAVPLFPEEGIDLGEGPDWAAADVRVSVIDTGWPPSKEKLDEFYGGREIDANSPKRASDADANAKKADIPDLESAEFPAEPPPDPDLESYLDPASGHGMFIAGLIRRYCPTAAVEVICALSTYGVGSEDAIALAIEAEANRDEKPDILNLSFGAYVFVEPDRILTAIQHALAAGIVVVASAGNEGITRKQYPAAFDGVISVGALDRYGPASFSNRGDWVRACAPGVDVASNFWIFDGKAPEAAGVDRDYFEGWALWSGTSFAAPIVAAAIAQTYVGMQGRAAPLSVGEAAELVVDYPGSPSIRGFGTIVSPPPSIAKL